MCFFAPRLQLHRKGFGIAAFWNACSGGVCLSGGRGLDRLFSPGRLFSVWRVFPSDAARVACCAGAKGLQFARDAVRFARFASPAAVPDKEVADKAPFFTRNQDDEILFNPLGGAVFGPAEPANKPLDMGVDDHARGLLKSITENDICRLAAHSGEKREGVNGFGHLSSMIFDERSGAALNVSCFCPKKSGAFYDLFEFGSRDLRVVPCSAAAFEELSGYEIDSYIRALGREDGRHEQFQRI